MNIQYSIVANIKTAPPAGSAVLSLPSEKYYGNSTNE